MSFAAFARAGVAARAVRRLTALGAATAMAVALTACGGGDQVNPFKPNKIVTFGDELSYIGAQDVQGVTLKGQKYGINFVVSDQAYYVGSEYQTAPSDALIGETFGAPVTYSLDQNGLRFIKKEVSATDSTHTRDSRTLWACSLEARLWTQILANSYGLGYATACPADREGAETYAVVGAKVADVIQQFNDHRGELNSRTLVTVWAGQNDVLEQLDVYLANPGSLPAIKAELRARGVQLGQAVNSLLDTGARALIVSLPDLGKAPGAGAHAVALTEMTEAFNQGFIGIDGVKNDGTKIGLVKAFELIQDIERVPGDYGMNVNQAACDQSLLKKPDGSDSTSLQDCVSGSRSTLIAGASLYSHLWASDFVLAPGGQARIGALAFERVNDNPF